MASQSRKAAYTALNRCLKSGAWSSITIDSCISDFQLSGRDAALAGRLCLGVLQNCYYLDYYIDFFSDNPKSIKPDVRNILRLGAYQILFNDRIPSHAAVNESVELCRDIGCGKASGLVNAVLRKISLSKSNLPEIKASSLEDYLSIKYSHPVWLVKKLINEYGYEKCISIMEADNTEPDTDIQINLLRTKADEFEDLLKEAKISYSRRNDSSFSVSHVKIPEIPGYSEGYFYVQDNAAHECVLMAEPQPGFKVLDACAAPGGKTFCSAIEMKNKGSIFSCDIHEKKLKLINDSAHRLGIGIIKGFAADASKYNPEFDSQFDLVIADVPCSGLGVIARKPEIRFKDEASLNGLPGIQSKILSNLGCYVRPGGRLLYSTCTIFKEENENIIENFLTDNRFFRLIHCKSFLPQRDSTGGFYAAVLERLE